MDQRGRSPSEAHQQLDINHSQELGSQTFPCIDSADSEFGLDGSVASTNNSNNQLYAENNYLTTQALSYGTVAHLFQPSELYPQTSLPQGFDQNQAFTAQSDSNQFKPDNFGQQQTSFSQDLLDTSNFNSADFPLYSPPTGSDQFDPSFFLNESTQSAQSINPADIMGDMSSPLNHVSSPPYLQPDAQQVSSGHASPSINQRAYSRSSGHSRHTSLGPESAAFPQAHLPTDWTGMMPPQFTTHRKTPSEYSDVSSAAPSPNLIQQDTFDSINSHHSPLLPPHDANMYADGLGIGSFTLSESNITHSSSPRSGVSPAPGISPSLEPQQQQLPTIAQQSQFLQNMGFPQTSEIYSGLQGPYAAQNNDSGEMGQAQQMVPPEINVEFAPASRQNSFEPPKPSLDQDALTPPERGRRRRAVSDPYNSVSSASRTGISSGLSQNLSSDPHSLSPQPSRSLSPLDRSGTSSPANRRRQSTSSLPNRDYILGLADPDYQAASGSSENGNAKRTQKHPATFQCTLCPKRFTRAYNLRSHLRTHTDERPFVCTVCGKAFARQHDRKRHEGLHSGEKKFVCKGELKQGGQWGCGRRFARADALGRHFRSEAGRICIKPLLDEEATERQQQWHQQEIQNMTQNLAQSQPITMDASGFPLDASGNYALPAALLAQYPALANVSWSDMPQGDVSGMEDDLSGRSSFDASDRSELYDEGDDGDFAGGQGTSYIQGHGHGQAPGQMVTNGYGGDYTGDYRPR